jgi:hypothetical protein
MLSPIRVALARKPRDVHQNQFTTNPIPLRGLRDLRAMLSPIRVALARKPRDVHQNQFTHQPNPPPWPP